MREVEFTPSYEAWTSFVAHEQRTEPLIARAQSRLTLAAYLRPVLGVPLFVFGFAWLLSWIANDMNRFGFVLGFVIWVLVALALAYRSAPRSLLSYLEAVGRDAARSGEVPQKQRVTLTPEGVTLTAPLSTSTLTWPLFTRIVIGKEFVTLEQLDFWSSIVIPTGVFASLEEQACSPPRLAPCMMPPRAVSSEPSASSSTPTTRAARTASTNSPGSTP